MPNKFFYQLVVEPLRALIFSQMKELKKRGVNVARLLPHVDVKTEGQFYAPDYLRHIVHNCNIGQAEPLIIFSTPGRTISYSTRHDINVKWANLRLLFLLILLHL